MRCSEAHEVGGSVGLVSSAVVALRRSAAVDALDLAGDPQSELLRLLNAIGPDELRDIVAEVRAGCGLQSAA